MVHEIVVIGHNGQPRLADALCPLLAHGIDAGYLHALLLHCLYVVQQLLDSIGVEGAAEARVGGEKHHCHTMDRTRRILRCGTGITAKKARRHVSDIVGIGAETLDILLRMMQLGRGHHLHGTRNLARALYGRDSILYFFQ